MGTIEVDPFSLMTSREGIFACGDVVTGTRSVAEASAMGRRAALSVDEFLGGDGLKELKDLQYVPTFFSEKKGGFAYLRRPKGEFSIKEATYESSRCLECDLRFQLMEVKFWPAYGKP